jgi:O-antigen/teichoic acid export membrane protein
MSRLSTLRTASMLLSRREDFPITETAQSLTTTGTPIPSLRANFAWTFAGNVLYGVCQWGMLSVLAKMGNASIVGQFTLGLAVSAPVFMFTNLQLRAVQATDVNAEHGFANYFTLRLFATLLGLLVVAALLPFVGTSSAVRVVILLVSLSKCVECMSDVTAGLLQREEQLKRVAISLMMRGVASVLVFSVTFAYLQSLALSISAMCGVWLAVLLFYDVRNVRALIGHHDPFFRFDGSELKRLALLGLPLGWVAALLSLIMNIPRYFLQHYRGLADQGIFASLAYLLIAISLLVTALSVSVTTRLARLFADGDLRQFVRLLTKLSMLGVLIAVVGVPLMFLVGRPMLTLLYRREYADHVGLLALFVGIAGLYTIGAFLFCGMTATRSFRAQVPVYLTAMLIGAATSSLLVPHYGLIGAALGLLSSMTIQMLGGIWALRQVIGVEAQKQCRTESQDVGKGVVRKNNWTV